MLLTQAWNRGGRHATALLSALVLAAAVVVAGCTETSPGVGPSQDPPASTNPDPAAKCQVVAVAPAAQSVGGLGASGSVTIATTSECTWTATTDADWITLTPPTHGSGNGMVNFAVAFNHGGTNRTGSLLIAGERSTITQAGFGSFCPFTIEPATQIIGAAGGAGAPIGVSTYPLGCRWTAASNAPWITVTAGASGAGNGVVAFSVEANTGAARTGTLAIAGHTATISQTAAGAPPPPPSPTACPSTISPDIQGMDPNGGGGHSVAVTTGSTCAWTATSNDGWITIDTGASGTGNGMVRFSVRSNNTGADRRGTLTIARRTATITQGRTGPRPR